jgi:signal peptidase I
MEEINNKMNSNVNLSKKQQLKKLIKKLIPLFIVIATVLLFRTKYMISYVPTQSMESYIMQGSIVISDKTYNDYKVGDVAIYNADEYGMKIIHRIKTIDKGEYQFQGDNNKYPDDNWVKRKNIISKYVWHSTTLGKIYKNGSQVIFILSFIFFGLYLFYDKMVEIISKKIKKE